MVLSVAPLRSLGIYSGEYVTSKRTFFVLFTVMLTVLVAGRVRTLPHAPLLPEALEQAENGWYWGENVDALAAAVPSDKGLTVYWVVLSVGQSGQL